MPFLLAVVVLRIAALGAKAIRPGGNVLDSAPSVIGGLTLPLCFLAVPRNAGRRDVAWACAGTLGMAALTLALFRGNALPGARNGAR